MRQTYLIGTKIACVIFLFFLMAVSSCRKDHKSPPEKPLTVEEIINTNDPAQPVITVPTNNILQPSKPDYNFIFNWETATSMPVPAGKPSVPMPWSDQAIKNYDPGLRNDYKKSDGWELVYNSFSDSLLFDHRIFILYNKYRGLLRYYTYNAQPVSPSLSSARWLINELDLYLPGDASPLFNFAGQFIVDVDVNTKNASLVEPWSLQESGWYISQFEMAYDRNAANFPVPQNRISWGFVFAGLDAITLNNVPATNKSINLQAPGVSFDDIWVYTAQLTGDFNLKIKSLAGFDNLAEILPASAINNLKQSAAAGNAGNMLTATLIPGAGMADCRLEMPGIMKLRPDLVSYIGGMKLAIPGPDNSKVIGLGPVFNEPMGVFYLGAKPVINHSKIAGATPEQYALDVSSLEYIINPFVKNYADVGNFKQEIVAVDEKETKSQAEAKIYAGKILKASRPLKILGVRVSFDVIPKNGSAPVKIIKTFLAKLSEI
jgi:hypothetical protein